MTLNMKNLLKLANLHKGNLAYRNSRSFSKYGDRRLNCWEIPVLPLFPCCVANKILKLSHLGHFKMVTYDFSSIWIPILFWAEVKWKSFQLYFGRFWENLFQRSRLGCTFTTRLIVIARCMHFDDWTTLGQVA